MKNIVEILSHTNVFSIASLATKTAVVTNSQFGTGLLSSFLMKKVRLLAFLKAAVAEETVIIGMARGDATVTEIKTAIENIQLERDLQDQANIRVVLMETLGIFASSTSLTAKAVIEMEVSLGGGKGIPFELGDGWAWFAYNPDNGNLSAGSQEVIMQASYYGVWL